MRAYTELKLHPYSQDYPCFRTKVALDAAGGQLVPRWKMKKMVEEALASSLDHLLYLYNTPLVVVEGDPAYMARMATAILFV